MNEISMNTEHRNTWAQWIVLVLLALLSPLFLFPRKGTAWLLMVVPLAFLVMWAGKKTDIQRTPLDWMILFLAFQVGVSGLIVADIDISLAKVTGFFFGVFIYYSLVSFLQTEKLIKIGILAFIVSGAILAVIGILGVSKHTEPKYIQFIYKIMKSLPSIHFNLPGAEGGFHPNAVGGGVIIALPLCFVLLLPYFTKKKISFKLKRSKGWFVTLLISFCVMAFVLLLTQSRSSFAGMFIVIWLLIFVGLRRRKIAVISITAVMLAVLISVFFLAGSKKLPYTDLESRNKLIGRVTTFWVPAVDQIKRHPVFGMGMNQARTIPKVGDDQGHLHNLFLHTAAEIGIPALIALLALLFGAAVLCIRLWRAPVPDWAKTAVLGLGCGQLALFIFGFLDVIPLGSKVGIFFWISLALIASLYNLNSKIIKESC